MNGISKIVLIMTVFDNFSIDYRIMGESKVPRSARS